MNSEYFNDSPIAVVVADMPLLEVESSQPVRKLQPGSDEE
jgi:hypothetical protein